MSSFSIALSGLTAASSNLDVTANNIANADTIGFKSSRAEFSDLYASGAANLNQSVTGEGVKLATNAQQFTQGNITTTSSNLDLAISGDGFYTLKNASGLVYSRNGQFQEDSSGNVVSSTGQALQVYPPLVTGGFNTGALVNLNLQTAQSAPQASTKGAVVLNLPANSAVPTGGAFNPRIPRLTTIRPRQRSTIRWATLIRRRSFSRRRRIPASGTSIRRSTASTSAPIRPPRP